MVTTRHHLATPPVIIRKKRNAILLPYAPIKQTHATFNQLPDEVIWTILSSLNYKDLLATSCICKRFYRISQDHFLWERLYIRLWLIEFFYIKESTVKPLPILAGSEEQFESNIVVPSPGKLDFKELFKRKLIMLKCNGAKVKKFDEKKYPLMNAIGWVNEQELTTELNNMQHRRLEWINSNSMLMLEMPSEISTELPTKETIESCKGDIKECLSFLVKKLAHFELKINFVDDDDCNMLISKSIVYPGFVLCHVAIILFPLLVMKLGIMTVSIQCLWLMGSIHLLSYLWQQN